MVSWSVWPCFLNFWMPGTAGALPVVSVWTVALALAAFRTEASPPLRALAEAERPARTRGWQVVADFNMFPFAEYQQLEGRLASPVLYDVELGRNRDVPPPASVVAPYTDDQDRFIVDSGPPELFRAETPLLNRLMPGPLFKATVVPAARVRPARRRRRGMRGWAEPRHGRT